MANHISGAEGRARPIYLDWNATTPIHPRVFAAMKPYLTDEFYNPSSSYACAERAKSAIEEARAQVATAINAESPSAIVFVSCGTEADNWAIYGSVMEVCQDPLFTARLSFAPESEPAPPSAPFRSAPLCSCAGPPRAPRLVRARRLLLDRAPCHSGMPPRARVPRSPIVHARGSPDEWHRRPFRYSPRHDPRHRPRLPHARKQRGEPLLSMRGDLTVRIAGYLEA